ncbi:MAG: ribbon-helix-helix protein, CopG family [Promethearchaeota archaeon]|nr:MAG: ribbon-helix-helix protein, CopG family [Candidatus Lokiarchaeota archaeon]
MPIISLQLSDDLLERFEKIRTLSGFNSKSEALRDAIVNFIENQEKFDKMEGYKITTISLVYPFKEVIINQISEIYSKFRQIIKTATDWRIAEKKIEIILAVGEFGLIKDLKNSLAKIKDVICSIHELVIE